MPASRAARSTAQAGGTVALERSVLPGGIDGAEDFEALIDAWGFYANHAEADQQIRHEPARWTGSWKSVDCRDEGLRHDSSCPPADTGPATRSTDLLPGSGGQGRSTSGEV